MKPIALYLVLGAILGSTGSAYAQQDEDAPQAAAKGAAASVEPGAVAALEKMGTYLRSLRTFSLHGETETEMVMENGQKLEFPGTIDYKVRAPNGLQIDVANDRKHRQLFYDGKTITVYGPKTKLYASADAPATIRELVSVLEERYDIELPLADLFLWGTDRAPTSTLTSAVFVGPARIDGTVTEQYAFRQNDVDWQVWIQTGNKPLPRRMVLTTTDDSALPEYAVTLTWDTNATMNDSAFTFVPPKDAHRIQLVKADAVAVEESTP